MNEIIKIVLIVDEKGYGEAKFALEIAKRSFDIVKIYGNCVGGWR